MTPFHSFVSWMGQSCLLNEKLAELCPLVRSGDVKFKTLSISVSPTPTDIG